MVERRRAMPIRTYRAVMRTIGRTNSRNVDTCQYSIAAFEFQQTNYFA